MLKRNEELDWMSRHVLALSSVTPLIARKEYKKCGIPLCGVIVQDCGNDLIMGGVVATVSILVLNHLL